MRTQNAFYRKLHLMFAKTAQAVGMYLPALDDDKKRTRHLQWQEWHYNMATEVVVIYNTHTLMAMRDAPMICLQITSIGVSKIRCTYFSNSKIKDQGSIQGSSRIDCDAEDC